MKKYAFTSDKRAELIDELESYLTEDFVREVQTRHRAWIHLNESIRVYPSDIVEIQDGAYNPNGWQAYPDVTPPTGVLMRVETKGGRRFCATYRTFSDGVCWCHADGTIMPETLSSSVIRFRPWED